MKRVQILVDNDDQAFYLKRALKDPQTRAFVLGMGERLRPRVQPETIFQFVEAQLYGWRNHRQKARQA